MYISQLQVRVHENTRNAAILWPWPNVEACALIGFTVS